ncbi:serine/threonine protein kinase [Streptomyces sp. NPDC002187]|uniref:serine/threonine protein kinase n=1 Tax=Streptomyces sp. NPDC002187 TaxID=3364637 RepID=UPI0036A33F0E
MTGPTQSPYTVPVPKGYRVGPWTVGEPLGAGAFGSVYAARRTAAAPGLVERAALKFLPTGTRTPRQLRHLEELAEREVALLRRLRSPRLIRMYETLTVDDPMRPELDGATVLVLEEADGSLDALLADGPGPQWGPPLLVQVCEGLAQLHGAGWIHGDLKPANVLLMPDGTARLGDFNMAAELEGTHAYSPAFSTPDYTPPELLWTEIGERGVRIRPTADIWAFGVLAHVVLTGTMPLPGGTPTARRDAAVRYARGADELRLSPELPGPWHDIVADCLARTHAERAAHDATSLLRRVEAAAAGTAAARRPRLRTSLRRRRTPQSLRRPLAAATAAVAALTALGFGVDRLAGAGGPEAYDRCADGTVCFFAESDGKGEMCSWVDGDDDWLTGTLGCAWTRARQPKSVFNNGHDNDMGAHLVDVVYFARTGWKERLGCITIRTKTNLTGAVGPRSHRWVESCDAPAPSQMRVTVDATP